jgi:hypothetical protein
MSSAPLKLESVVRFHFDSTTSMRPNIAVNVSQGALSVGCADKEPAFGFDDAHGYAVVKTIFT